ncbi:MAG: redoxin domain-containing protein, partial [Gammaproteobacteria bacterium]|nr:redoxin domain-containing protein [Gammaproteobacteria bacterium]
MAVNTISAPDFPEALEWYNTEQPARLNEYRGRVVLLNFSTYGSLQCVHTLDDLEYLQNRYQDNLLVIGVHTPRFPGERTASHIRKIISRHNINHPLVNDAGARLTQLYGIRREHTLVVIGTSGNILGAVSSGNKRYKLDRIIGQLLSKADRPAGRAGAATTGQHYREPVCPLSFPGR